MGLSRRTERRLFHHECENGCYAPASLQFKRAKHAFKDHKEANFELPEKTGRGRIEGNWVIAGGALGSSNEDVYKKFIELAKEGSDAKVGIISAASGSLSSSYAFKNDLLKYELKEENIKILPISTHDFKELPWMNQVGRKTEIVILSLPK
ncbi:hypothetical protein [Peribacillus muralis]|uniref:hypothetical protein n=1 Tax=Peribacillus muralis TaxID=264697 RepID=UPI003D067D02